MLDGRRQLTWFEVSCNDGKETASSCWLGAIKVRTCMCIYHLCKNYRMWKSCLCVEQRFNSLRLT